MMSSLVGMGKGGSARYRNGRCEHHRGEKLESHHCFLLAHVKRKGDLMIAPWFVIYNPSCWALIPIEIPPHVGPVSFSRK
jgi:hypothetical protein